MESPQQGKVKTLREVQVLYELYKGFGLVVGFVGTEAVITK